MSTLGEPVSKVARRAGTLSVPSTSVELSLDEVAKVVTRRGTISVHDRSDGLIVVSVYSDEGVDQTFLLTPQGLVEVKATAVRR